VDALKKSVVAVSRADIILITLFVVAGVFGSFLVDRAVGWLGKGFEPRESRTQLRYGLQWKQDELAMTRKEQTATEDQLIKSRLEHYGHEAALAALEATPAPAAEARDAARLKLGDSARRTNALIERLRVLQQKSNALRGEVEEAGRLAALDFGFYHVVYKLTKALASLLLTLMLLWAVFKGMKRLLDEYAAGARADARAGDGEFVLKAVAAALVILLAYQAFQTAGAAVAGAVVLLLFINDRRRAAGPAAAKGEAA
jgi:hypothetical protein